MLRLKKRLYLKDIVSKPNQLQKIFGIVLIFQSAP